MIKHFGERRTRAFAVVLLATAGCVARDVGNSEGTGIEWDGGSTGGTTPARKPAAPAKPPAQTIKTVSLDLVGNKIVAVPEGITLPEGARTYRVQAARGAWTLYRCQMPSPLQICSKKERNNPDFEGFFFQLGQDIESAQCTYIGNNSSASFDVEYMAGWNRGSGSRKTVWVTRAGPPPGPDPTPEPLPAATRTPPPTPLPEETPIPIDRDGRTIYLDFYRGPGGKRVGLARPGGFEVTRPDQQFRFKALRGTWGLEDTVLKPGKLDYIGAAGSRHPVTSAWLADEVWYLRDKELASPSVMASGYMFKLSVFDGQESVLEVPLSIKIQYVP